MEELQSLQMEVDSLRSLLTVKEAQLCDLRRKSTHDQLSECNNVKYSVPQPVTLEDMTPSVAETAPAPPPPLSVGDILPRWAIERYSRQILLSGIGVEGQERVCAARVLVVGAGGLGCPALAYLVGAGIGTIGIVDYDTVDVTNLHRQLLHRESQHGVSKVDSAAQALRSINSQVVIKTYNLQLDSKNALQVLADYDVVLDCTDNVPTRYLLNDACVLLKIPLISGSALKMEGQLTIYGYRPGDSDDTESQAGPCYRCLFPVPPPPETVGSCSAQGVLGPIPGVVGTLQALETLKLVAGQPRSRLLVARMLLFDGEDCSFRNVKLRGRVAECPVCSDTPQVKELLDYEAFCQARAQEKKKEEARLKSLRRKEEKDKRMSGRSYLGFRKAKDPVKEKWVQDVPKGERVMGPSCTSEICAKSVSKLCRNIPEESRKEIFNKFWNEMDWREKRNYVRSLVDLQPPRRRRTKHKGNISRKGDSKIYHLIFDEKRLSVCRQMFLSTLGIKEAMVRCWLAFNESEKPKGPKKKPIKAQNVGEYLDCLPKFLPKCEQCRSSTSKLYLDHSLKNQHQLYRRYVDEMKDNGISPASRKTFAKVYAQKNYRIFKPKSSNDVCDLIAQHNATDDIQPEFVVLNQPGQTYIYTERTVDVSFF